MAKFQLFESNYEWVAEAIGESIFNLSKLNRIRMKKKKQKIARQFLFPHNRNH